MIPSPPQEPAQVRGETLTPVSPKPAHYPSPSNIPILERQMDPSMFNEASAQLGHPTPFQPMPQQTYPATESSVANPLYENQDGSAHAQGYSHNNGNNNDTESYPQSYGYDGGAAAVSHSQGINPSSHGNGGIDFQTLLNTLAPAISNQSPEGDPSASQTYSQFSGTASTSNSALPSHPNLPPRPPPQEKPATHPNYAPEDDIRSYHPHSSKPTGAYPRTQTGLAPIVTGTPGTNTMNNFQPTPLSATQGTHTPSTPGQHAKDGTEARVEKEEGDGDEAPWPPEVQRLYDQFLVDERANVTEGQWDKFPSGSRLFIGNLPTEKVTKRDLFHIFHRHGKLAQISLKQAYGFVQFMDTSSCRHALANEQGQMVRGRKMHLEISKPQRNSGNAANRGGGGGGGARRRSRSPDYNRGSGQSRGVDRYTGGQGSPRERDFRRGRDDYRPGRSPSPRGGRRRDRSRDRYRRSRTRSPPGRGGRYRSPSPQRDSMGSKDDIPLPRRKPHEVPDIQIIVLEDLDRNFIAWVEKAFNDRGVRADVLLLSPRLSEAAVVRRQILEGVLAVSRLTIKSQQTGKIPLQVFDRSGGADNVRFEEYVDLDPPISAELVLRAKKTSAAPAPQYGLPTNYGVPQQQQYGMPAGPPTGPTLPSNLSSAISSLDGPALQQLLGAMQQNAYPQQQQQGMPNNMAQDLSRLLGNAVQQQPNPYGQQGSPTTQTNPYASLAGNPALASLLGNVAPQQSGSRQSQPSSALQSPTQPPGSGESVDMANLMAQLQSYRR